MQNLYSYRKGHLLHSLIEKYISEHLKARSLKGSKWSSKEHATHFHNYFRECTWELLDHLTFFTDTFHPEPEQVHVTLEG